MPAKYLTKSHNFDPTLIISQMFLISSIYYLLQILFTFVFNTLFGLKLHIDQILSSDALDFSTSYGVAYICTSFFTYLFMTVALIITVDKANKILDYVLTNFFFHLILTTLNSHFPSSFMWWSIHTCFLIVVTLISEYISLKLDQRGIKLSFNLEGDKKI
jgi:hypothetical protein